MNTLPVAVIGAGPIGLAAAAHLLARGETPIVFEAGSSVGAAIREWGHVRLFSPWRYLVDREATALLEQNGWVMPEPEGLPLGRELVEQYLEPLATHPDDRADPPAEHRGAVDQPPGARQDEGR